MRPRKTAGEAPVSGLRTASGAPVALVLSKSRTVAAPPDQRLDAEFLALGREIVFGLYAIKRAENRIPMAVAVRIAGHAALPGVETTFTADVSSRGARVYSTRRWKPDERLFISTLAGEFRSLARVAWCHPARDAGFAVGLQLVETSGKWVVAPAAAKARAS